MRDYQVKPIQSLARGFEVVKLLQSTGAASLNDLHRATGIPKASLLRILRTAHEAGLVWQRMVDNAFLPSQATAPALAVDDAAWLAELASPVIEQLAGRVRWPSALTIPRLEYMETIETNSGRAYFDELPPAARGYRANMLRSASGRAYLAYCPDAERESVLERLRSRDRPGNALAHDRAAINYLVEATRAQGYALRTPDFGGDFDLPRDQVDDGRESIAVPVQVRGRVIASLNVTWRRGVLQAAEIVRRHLADLEDAASTVAQRVEEASPSADNLPR